MAQFTSPLERVRVAAPCAAEWERMVGGERVRFCAQCSLNVYNLSGMTRHEAEALLTRTEGRLCVRFFRREDGTILTEQCPVGLRALKARVSRTAAALFSAVVGLLGGLGLDGLAGSFGAVAPWGHGRAVMGEMVAPTDAGSHVRPSAPRAQESEPAVGVRARPEEIGERKLAPPAVKKNARGGQLPSVR